MLSAVTVLAGCALQVPEGAFTVSGEVLAQRQIQSRRFDGLSEEEILQAGANVLQDMGYNLDASETSLGLLTGSKERDAVNAGEVAGAVLVALLTGYTPPVSAAQKIRVSLVVRPAGSESVIAPEYAGAAAAGTTGRGEFVVRATFQRVVTRTDRSTYVETINDPAIYQEFFDKLSKSVFIEAQKI